MTGATDLQAMLANLQVQARPGQYVFVCNGEHAPSFQADALATICEAEGMTCVLPRERAEALGLAFPFVAAWLTVQVRSALHAVGLTASLSEALASHGIACNVLAGFHHDHLLVPADRRDDALAALRALQQTRFLADKPCT